MTSPSAAFFLILTTLGVFVFYQRSQIATLSASVSTITQQATDLQTANVELTARMKAYTQAQTTANDQITQAQTATTQATASANLSIDHTTELSLSDVPSHPPRPSDGTCKQPTSIHESPFCMAPRSHGASLLAE